MNVAFHRPMTIAEFLAWERTQELRYEFDGVQPVAMTCGTVEHSVVATNLVEMLGGQLRSTPCRAFRGDLKILVAGRVRYPDAIVTCTPVARGTDLVPEPVVVFEVLSSSTASVDRIEKNQEYRATPSIQRYVMLEQTRQAATVFSRAGDDWVGHVGCRLCRGRVPRHALGSVMRAGRASGGVAEQSCCPTPPARGSA